MSNFSELRKKINNWDLEAEEMLIQKIRTFTDSYIDEFNLFSKNMDSLNMQLESAEIENYKTINQLKILSTKRFVEEIVEEPKDSDPEVQNNNNEEQKSQIIITDVEENKKVIDISMQSLQEIQSKKEKNKEKVEDTVSETVSVVSSKLNIDNNLAKSVRLPFIIGTEDFAKDKTLGLTLFAIEEEEKGDNKKEEENEKEDSDIEEFVSDIHVEEKQRVKWEKIKQKKKEKETKNEKKTRI